MTRRSTFLLCGLMLTAGIGIGSTYDSWTLAESVRADALDVPAVQRTSYKVQSDVGALVDGGNQLAEVAKLTTPSVVHIQSERTTGGRTVEETGSGIIVQNSKATGMFVVTNRHVVRDAKRPDISIHLFDGRVIHPEKVWTDAATDVAIMKVSGKNLRPAKWADSDKVEIGHMVLAMGSPFGLSRSVTFGIVSAKSRRSLRLGAKTEVINQNFLQTDAAINPGNSGGPLIDLQGRVVGINTAIASNSGGNDGIGFSIPSNLVVRVIDELLEHGKVQRAYLGVKLDPNLNEKTSIRLKLNRVHGARVVEVYPNTPASRAKLKFDDVILEFNGIGIQDENHLINLVSLTNVKKQVQLLIWRNGRQIKISVVLGDREELEQRTEAPTRPGMGIQVETMGLTLHEMDGELAGQLGFAENPNGLLVLRIDPTGPLSSQIELYDLIEEVARTPVYSVGDLDRTLDENLQQGSVLLKIRRRVQGKSRSRLVVWER